ncbi:MAG TPA: hypothetical protein VNH53_06680 [Sphingomicrobium sp.]|nr:hypothetical protein [Sphingomicrobium sp.]
MAYQLSPRLFVENGPAVQAAKALGQRSSRNALLSWRGLDSERRLALVDAVLKPAPLPAACTAI